MYAYMYVCMYVHVHMYVGMYICTCTYVYMYACIYYNRYSWKDVLFDVTWSEIQEQILVAASGDGSLLVFDQACPQVLSVKIYKHLYIHWCMEMNRWMDGWMDGRTDG